jgi:6-phosphogluconate dehydrogenase
MNEIGILDIAGMGNHQADYVLARGERLLSDFFQAQRDLIGAQTHTRIDHPRVFHLDWGLSTIEAVHL